MPSSTATNPPRFDAVRVSRNVAREIRSFVLPLFPTLNKIYWEPQPFHSDEHWKGAVKTMLSRLPVTAVAETGTNRGDSTCFLADHFSGPVYTCEIMGLYFRESRCRFRTYRNIQIHRGSSPPILRSLANDKKFGELPLLFLDAHWYDYWPLHDELAIVTNLRKAIVMIDDFEVPGKPAFGYDVYVERNALGGEATRNNNLEFISGFLDRTRHSILFPNYEATASGARGHIIIFQDADEEFETIKSDPVVDSDYIEYMT